VHSGVAPHAQWWSGLEKTFLRPCFCGLPKLAVRSRAWPLIGIHFLSPRDARSNGIGRLGATIFVRPSMRNISSAPGSSLDIFHSGFRYSECQGQHTALIISGVPNVLGRVINCLPGVRFGVVFLFIWTRSVQHLIHLFVLPVVMGCMRLGRPNASCALLDAGFRFRQCQGSRQTGRRAKVIRTSAHLESKEAHRGRYLDLFFDSADIQGE
jgi:hypothetical protein